MKQTTACGDGPAGPAVTSVAGGTTATPNCRRVRVRWRLLIALALLGQVVVATNSPTLVPGMELPLLEVTALSGDLVALPRDARGHAAVLVIGFTKAAAKISRPWLDACQSAAGAGPAGSGVYCYDIRMLEGVPRSFRGMVERGMRGSFPAELQRQTLLVYAENDAWRQRVGADDDKKPYVIGIDAEGRVRATAAGQCGQAELRKMLEAIAPTSPSRE